MTPSPEPINEQELLRRVANEDEAAFSVLYKRYYGRVTNYLASITNRPAADLYDITQEVFMAVWERSYLLPQVDCFESYACIMAKNALLNAERGRLIRKRILSEYAAGQPLPDTLPENNAVYKCLHRWVADTIAGIPGRGGDVVRLYVVHGLSHRQIARELNISTQMVGRHILKAKERIYRQLDRYGHGLLIPLMLVTRIWPDDGGILQQMMAANWLRLLEEWVL
jgi:RNA polymerase sigma-70 factor (ECF subfamily)